MVSCNGLDAVSSEELHAYVLNPKNGLMKSLSDGDIRVDLVYRPKDLVVEQEADGDTGRREEAERNLDSLDYFILQVSRNGNEIENEHAGNPDKFSKIIGHLSSSIAADIYLLKERKFYPESSILARGYGMSGATSVLLVFKTALSKQKDSFTIIFDDSFLGIGRKEFQFECDDIHDAPRLKL